MISYTTNDREAPETAWCALAEAIRTRRPPKECIIHCDHGYQFTAHQWLALAEGAGMRVSFGANKSPLDNAAMESWFSSHKSEELYPNGTPRTRAEARQRLFNYVWQYNTRRRHSALGNVAPRTFITESATCP